MRAPPLRRVALSLLLALIVLPVASCGGGEDDEAAREFYGAYRSTEDERTKAEGRLRRAFSDIASAADRRDRAGVLDAAERGRRAAADIERFLAKEIGAAARLEQFKRLSVEAGRLKQGLEMTRKGLRLFVQELRIGERDPFLDDEANANEITHLARNGARLSVDGELSIRRADRALALALGIEPRLDPLD